MTGGAEIGGRDRRDIAGRDATAPEPAEEAGARERPASTEPAEPSGAEEAEAEPFPTAAEPADWRVYVLVSTRRGRTYVGITRDLARRLAQHNGELPGGAKATRAGRPWRVGASHGPFASRGEAQRVERAIKSLRGRRRLTWRS